MVKSKFKLVLASSSPRRKELLGHLKIPFQIITRDTPEHSDKTDPAAYCHDIAFAKNNAVFQELRSLAPHDHLFVISADTIVCMKDRIYGKPRDRDDARTILKELSGKIHSVFTAVAVQCFGTHGEDGFSFVDESRVTFNPLSHNLLETYLETGDSLDKAGAYGIQGPSLTFISEVNGSYSNVVGFPLSRFVTEVEKYIKKINPTEASWLDSFVR